MHAKCKGRDPNAIKGNCRGLYAKSWQNAKLQDKGMLKVDAAEYRANWGQMQH